jgi:hypothetical protein
MKDAAVGDTLRGGDEQPLIRRFLNGETLYEQSYNSNSIGGEHTSGSETSQYREEKRLTHGDLYAGQLMLPLSVKIVSAFP